MRKIFVLLSLVIGCSLTVRGMNDSFLGTNNEVVSKSRSVMSLQELNEYFSQVSVARWDVCKHILDSVSYKESGESNEEDLGKKIKQRYYRSISLNYQYLNKDLSIASHYLVKCLFYDKVFQENQDVLTLLISYKNEEPISTDELNILRRRFKNDPLRSIADFIKIGSGGYPLHKACKKNYENIVKWLMELGADVNGRSIFTCRTPLFAACKTGNKFIVEYLLGHDAEINVKDYKKETPLFGACKNGHVEIVKFLLEHGADVNRKNNSTETPLFIACENGHEKIVELLIEYGANVNVKNEYEETPLIIARRNGYENIVKVIEKYGANVKKSNIGMRMLFRKVKAAILRCIAFINIANKKL